VSEPIPHSVAVTLSLAPSLEERMIDWLLGRDDVATFTEQVSGRQYRVELRVEVRGAAIDAWLAALAAGFAGADVDYLVTPILRSGRLSAVPRVPAHAEQRS
jgi:hypothetical protein